MRTVRIALIVVALLGALPARAALTPQNDAGSGKDAADGPSSEITIQPGIVYDGVLEAPAAGGDVADAADWYAVEVTERGFFKVSHTGASCFAAADASGAILQQECDPEPVVGGITVAVSAPGTYYAVVFDAPGPYRFGVGVNESAPDILGLVGALFGETGPLPAVSPASMDAEHTVLAVVDTGINPYHEFFRAPALTEHPSTWLEGFPADAASLDLSFDGITAEESYAADATTWASVERTTFDEESRGFGTRLYTFPGTRIVGAVSLGEYDDLTEEGTPARAIIDDVGHGTHSAGLAGGALLDAPDGDVLLVIVEVGQGSFEQGVLWAARQPWIDAITVSLGTRANAPTDEFINPIYDGSMTPLDATREAARNGKRLFVSSGNGVSGLGVAADRCSTYTNGWVGPVWITRVGAADYENGQPTTWHCAPVDVIAKTGVPVPSHRTLTGTAIGTGTSASTPVVAGVFAHLQLHARSAALDVTSATILEHLLHAAAPSQETPNARGPGVPYPASIAEQGYGLVDQAAYERALQSLDAGSAIARPETEVWFASDRAIRDMLWGPVESDGRGTPNLEGLIRCQIEGC